MDGNARKIISASDELGAFFSTRLVTFTVGTEVAYMGLPTKTGATRREGHGTLRNGCTRTGRVRCLVLANCLFPLLRMLLRACPKPAFAVECPH